MEKNRISKSNKSEDFKNLISCFVNTLKALSRSFKGILKVSQRYLIGISKVSDRFTIGSSDMSVLNNYTKFFSIRVIFVNVQRYTGLSPPLVSGTSNLHGVFRVFMNLNY